MQRPLVTDAYDLVQSSLLGDAAEHASIGILVADDDMRLLAANRYACELLGYDRDELLSLHTTDISPSPGAREQWAEMLRRGEIASESTIVRKDGTELDIHFFAGVTKMASMQMYLAFVRPLTA